MQCQNPLCGGLANCTSNSCDENLQVEVLDSLADEMVSKIPYSGKYTDEKVGEIWIGVGHADGMKCERCWNYSPQVGSFTEHPTLCARCFNVVDLQPLPAVAAVS